MRDLVVFSEVFGDIASVGDTISLLTEIAFYLYSAQNGERFGNAIFSCCVLLSFQVPSFFRFVEFIFHFLRLKSREKACRPTNSFVLESSRNKS